MLVLDHLLVAEEQVCGGFFLPADPTSKIEDERVASLTLLTPGGHIIAKDDAALILFDLFKARGMELGQGKDSLSVSRHAAVELITFFERLEKVETLPDYIDQAFQRCRLIMSSLAKRV